MVEVEVETIRTGVPILFGVRHVFKRSHGCERFVSQGVQDKFVEFPDPFDCANLGSCKVLAQRIPSQKLGRASIPVLDHAGPRTHEAPRAGI